MYTMAFNEQLVRHSWTLLFFSYLFVLTLCTLCFTELHFGPFLGLPIFHWLPQFTVYTFLWPFFTHIYISLCKNKHTKSANFLLYYLLVFIYFFVILRFCHFFSLKTFFLSHSLKCSSFFVHIHFSTR